MTTKTDETARSISFTIYDLQGSPLPAALRLALAIHIDGLIARLAEDHPTLAVNVATG